MVLQWSKLFHSKISVGFLLKDSQSLYTFGKIQNLGGPKLSEEKNLVFHWRKISYFHFTYIYLMYIIYNIRYFTLFSFDLIPVPIQNTRLINFKNNKTLYGTMVLL